MVLRERTSILANSLAPVRRAIPRRLPALVPGFAGTRWGAQAALAAIAALAIAVIATERRLESRKA